MTAPAPSSRTTPVGTLLKDGYQTLVAFAADTDVSLWEKTVQPPGFDGGDEIDITTMHNTTWRTMAARSLMTLTNAQMTVAYDPAVVPQIEALINVETTVTVINSNGDKLAFFGYLKTFEPQEVEEGSQPEATCEIVPTNVDPVAGTEEGPVLTTAAGTAL